MTTRPRSNSSSGLPPTRTSPRTPSMSRRAVEGLLSSIDQMELQTPSVKPEPTSSSSSSSSSPKTEPSSSPKTEPPLPSVGLQLRALVLDMQQSLEAANRRSEEATRRADEALDLMRQLIQQQQVKGETKAMKQEPPPPFIPPSSSSSSSGMSSTLRHQQLQAVMQGDNQGILSIAKAETQQLQHLHNPTVNSSPSSPPLHRLPPSQHPLLFLPQRLLHPSPLDNPSSAESLLNAFLLERRSGDLVHKKIKSFDDWMRGMEDGIKQAISAGNMDSVQQSIKYITLMSDFNSTYGWAAADAYWYELQKEVHAGYHSLLMGSPWNARAFMTMTSKYQPLSGRPQHGTSSTSTSSSSSSSTSSPSSSSSSSSTRRVQNLECSHHGKHSSHTTADCKFLANQKSGTPTKSS